MDTLPVEHWPLLNEQWTTLLDVINVLKYTDKGVSKRDSDEDVRTDRNDKEWNVSSNSKATSDSLTRNSQTTEEKTKEGAEGTLDDKLKAVESGEENEEILAEDRMNVDPETDPITKEELERLLEAQKTCATCGRKFASKKSRRRHEISHSTARPHACEFCGKTFKLKVRSSRECPDSATGSVWDCK